MKKLTMSGDRRMTIREVAEVLGYDVSTITKKVRELYPELMRQGKTTYLNEARVTAIKISLGTYAEVFSGSFGKKSEVALTPKTELEEALLIHHALRLQQARIKKLQGENAELRQENQALIADRYASTAWG